MVDEAQDERPAARLRDLGAYIRDQRNRSDLSLRHLAKLAGVSNPYLSQIERGLRKPSAEILQAIAKALRISAETLYVKAGILEVRDSEEDLESAIAREPHLTEPQRQALVEMYRSFRRLAELQQGEAGAPPADSPTVSDRAADAVRGLLDRASDETAAALGGTADRLDDAAARLGGVGDAGSADADTADAETQGGGDAAGAADHDDDPGATGTAGA